MNIALLTMGFYKDRKEATAQTILSFASSLKKRGHNVFIITESLPNAPKHEVINNVPIYRQYYFGKFTRKRNLRNFILPHMLGIKYVQKKEGIRFDIVHSFSIAPIASSRAILSKIFAPQAKLVHTIKGKPDPSVYGGYTFTKFLNLFDKITTPTEDIKQNLISVGCKKNKIKIIHSHINFSKFKLKVAKPKEYPSKRKIILCFGGFSVRKSITYLIRALPKVIKKHKKIFLVFASRGGAKAQPHLLTLIKELKLENFVKIVGEIDVAKFIKYANIVVLPYIDLIYTEGNPSTLLEAMACKIPVVTTDLPGLREIVKPGEDVLMAKPKDSESLAKEIIRLLKDKKLQNKLVKNAYEKSKQFDVNKITEQFIDVYKEVLYGS